jgi:hypothetical protein
MRSAGPIAFGPDGILFVADSDSAAIFALEVGDGPARGPIRVDIDDIETRLGAYLGCGPEDVFIRDMAVHPSTQEVYFSLTRGSGQQATPVLLKASGDGAIEALSLDDIPYSKTTIQDAPAEDDARVEVRVGVASDPRDGEMMEPRPGFKLRVARDPLRQVTVTDLAYVDGVLLVAGASNEEFSSTLRRIPFPFGDPADSASLEIFHVSHGKYETASPIRAFVPFGGTNVLASYTCTPVVQFSLAGIAASTQLKGKTVAELGAGNTPLDMVAYRRDGEEFLLVSNSRHPLMKIATKDIPGQAGLTEPREPMGVPRESLEHAGVSRMANLDGEHVLMLQRGEDGKLNLRSHDCRDL